jgi:hypothetical protein
MNKLLKVEEFALFVLCLFLYSGLGYPWWAYAALFLAPDLSMLGYLGGPASGAAVYNFVHHKALAVGLYLLGALLAEPVLQFSGLILLGHSSLDRALGYGLKYPDSFHNTHLGRIGRPA